jgi:hypothetical protein
MKEHLHLLKLHQAGQELHGRLAKTHARIAELHRTASNAYTLKSAGEAMSDCHKSMAAEHDDLADYHRDQSAFHADELKKLEAGEDYDWPGVSTERNRGAGGDLDGPRKVAGSPWEMARAFDKVVPDHVHGVLPSAPGAQLVPRPGGPRVEFESATETIDKVAGR